MEAQLRAFARSRGVRLPEAGASTSGGGDADGAPTDRLAPVWDALRLAGVAEPGLAFAAWTDTAMLGGLVPPILANSPDIRTMLDRLRHFHPLVGRHMLVVGDRGGRTGPVHVSLRAADGGPADPDPVAACFALLCRTVLRLAGETAGPDRVLLRRPEPAQPAAYRDMLGPAVAFGQPDDVLVFGRTALRSPVPQADPVVLSMLAPYAQRRLTRDRTPWSAAVRTALRTAPAGPTGRPRLADVARAMAVGSRTLQLRLRQEDTTFSGLLDELQRERVLALLAEPEPTGLPVTVIAARTGFATPAALTRAVRRWAGMTPTEYRRGHAPTGRAAE